MKIISFVQCFDIDGAKQNETFGRKYLSSSKKKAYYIPQVELKKQNNTKNVSIENF